MSNGVIKMVKARNIGIPWIKQPTKECSDPNCPFHGTLPIRGILLEGTVVSKKMKNTVVVRHDYLFYDKKYRRYERRRKKIHAHLPPCIDVEVGDKVIIGECRPLSKTVAFVVLTKKEV